MATYQPTPTPSDAGGFRLWVADQLRAIAAALYEPELGAVTFSVKTAAPARIREGLTVLADGASWNPGAGKGVYTYHSGGWQKLG